MLALVGARATAADLSLDVTGISDYLFRGVDRTDGPALQAELDYLSASGAYVGAWASNARAVGGAEVDAYGGYSGSFTVLGALPASFDGGAIAYLFTGSEDAAGSRRNLDFAEAYAGLRFGPAAFKAYVSPDYANSGGVSASLRGTLNWPLLHQIGAHIEGGFNLGPGLRAYSARLTKDGEGRNYFDYRALLEYAPGSGFTVAAGVAGTTLNIADARGRSGNQPRLLLSLSKRFDF